MKTQKIFLGFALLITSLSFGQITTESGTGNVGIGTTTPEAKLDVAGDLQVNGGADSFYGFGTASSAKPIDARPNSQFPYVFNWHTGLTFSAHSAYGGIRFYNQGYPDMYGSGVLVMSINNNNVGIGTATPGVTLDVVGSTRISNSLILGQSGQSVDWNNYSYGSYIDVNNSQNALRVRDKNNTIMLEVNGSSNYFTGNVGIGTTTPTAKLQVEGLIKSYVPDVLGGNLNDFQLLDERAGNVTSNRIYNRLWTLRDGGPNNWFGARLHDGVSVDASFATPHTDTRTWWERDPNDNIQSWGNAGDTYLTINNGNVGIGSTDVKFQTKLYVKENGTSNSIWRGRIVASGEINAVVMGEYNGKAWLGAHNSQLNGWSDLIIQADGGKVGIGTTTPDQKLTVNGIIHAKEIIVDTNITPDYVFQKYYTGKSTLKSDYVMPTLAEIESFTKKNHHLPNVPSAQEVQQNGVSLGTMSNVLLQKVEELTLYAIEQNKVIEELKAQVTALMAKKQ